MSEFKKLEELGDSLKQYLMINIEIVKLEATAQISTTGASMASMLFVGISVFLFVLTITISVGFYLSELLDNTYLGFAIIAAFYFLLAIILFVGRKRIIEKPMRDKIIKKMLEDKAL